MLRRRLETLCWFVLLAFLFFRLYEWNATTGKTSAASVLNPSSLSVRKLRSVLDHRGLLYNGVFEKSELARLVLVSGGVTYAELQSAEYASEKSNETNLLTPGNSFSQEIERNVVYFSGAVHFYEQVEDCKDSVWLFQVVAKRGRSPLTDTVWRQLVSRLRSFGIRFGIYDCSDDSRLCAVKQWNTSRLMLAIPDANTEAKGVVKIQPYTGPYHVTQIVQFVYARTSINVRKFTYSTELTRWIGRINSAGDVSGLLLVSSLTLPPFFLSTLSAKFAARVRFGQTGPVVFNRYTGSQQQPQQDEDEEEEEEDEDEDENEVENEGATDALEGGRKGRLRRLQNMSRRLPEGRYYFITNRGMVEYGSRGTRLATYAHEQLNLSSLESFLRSLAPDLNDIFLFSLGLVNLLAVASLFDLRASPLQALLHFVWTLFKYNSFLLFGWIILLAVSNREPVVWLGQKLLTIVRTLLLLWPIRSIANDWRTLLSPGRAWLTTVIYTLFNAVLYLIRRRFYPNSLVEPEAWSEWFRLNRPLVVLNPGTGRYSLYRTASPHRSGRLRALLARLNMTEYSLPGGLSYEFLFDLPIRSFGRSCNRKCFRCITVRVLKLRRLGSLLAENPCEKCAIAKSVSYLQACSICLESYRMDDQLCHLPCGHVYHQNCVFSWLLTDSCQTCPCCRWPAYARKTPGHRLEKKSQFI